MVSILPVQVVFKFSLFFYFYEFLCKEIVTFLGTARESEPWKFLPSICSGWKIADAA